MSVYKLDKLMAETRRLAAEYRKTTGSPLAVSGELARFDAARLLDLELCEQRGNGVDAIGRGKRAGRRIQIKGRVIFDEHKGGQRIGQLNPEGEWDSVVLIIMDEEYEPVEIFEVTREAIMEAIESKQESQRTKRGALSVAKFKAIGESVWRHEATSGSNANV